MKENIPSKDWGPFKKVSNFNEGWFDSSSQNPKFGETGNLIIRQTDVKSTARALDMNSGEPVEVVWKLKRVFDRVRDDYNIPVAVHVVLSGTKEKPIISLLTDKIEGQKLDGNVWFDEISDVERVDLVTELDNLFSSLAEYFIDNHKKHDFLWDIASPRQYIWGRKADKDGVIDNKPHLYLVDVDIMTNAGAGAWAAKWDSYRVSLMQFIDDYQKKLNADFVKTKEVVKRLLDIGI